MEKSQGVAVSNDGGLLDGVACVNELTGRTGRGREGVASGPRQDTRDGTYYATRVTRL